MTALWLHSSTVSSVKTSLQGWDPDSPHVLEIQCSLPTPGASAAWPSRETEEEERHISDYMLFILNISIYWQQTAVLTSGSDSKVLGGGVSLGGFFSSLSGPMLGGGRWKRRDWSCCALGQGRVPLTHSTGSSQTAFCPWTWWMKNV